MEGIKEEKQKSVLRGKQWFCYFGFYSTVAQSLPLSSIMPSVLLHILCVLRLVSSTCSSVFLVEEEKKTFWKQNDSSFIAIHRPGVRFARKAASQKRKKQPINRLALTEKKKNLSCYNKLPRPLLHVWGNRSWSVKQLWWRFTEGPVTCNDLPTSLFFWEEKITSNIAVLHRLVTEQQNLPKKKQYTFKETRAGGGECGRGIYNQCF